MTEHTIPAPIELTDDELLAVSGGQITVSVVHSGGNETNTIGIATGGNSGGTNNENGGNASATFSVGSLGNNSSVTGSLSAGAGSSTSITFVSNS
jgi:hypothetical protein